MSNARFALPLVLAAASLGATVVAAASCGSSGSSASPGDAAPVDGGAESAMPDASQRDATGDALPAGDGGASDGRAGGGDGGTTMYPGANFALRHYYLGDTDRSGVPSSTAWEGFGINIDGKTTTAASTDVCTLTAGASTSTQVDGTGGIDNSWGANLMPLLMTTFGASLSTDYNAAVDSGAFTTMIDLVDLNSAMQAGACPGVGFAGAQFPGTPTWTPADDWPVYPDWLNDGGLASGSKIAFPSGGFTAGTWFSGVPVDLPFELSFGSVRVEVVIHHALINFFANYTPPLPSTAQTGTIGGILYTQEVIDALVRAAGWTSPSLCSESAFSAVADQIRQAQDVLHDGTNTAGQPCDAISIGLGFDGTQIAHVQSVAAPEAPLQPMCDASLD